MNVTRKAAGLVVVVAFSSLTGCGAPAPIEAETASSFQEQVRALATLTQQGEMDRAIQEAAALKADVAAAEQAGNVTPGRADRIEAGIDDFVASLGTAAEPTPAETAAEAPAETTTPAPAPPATVTDEGGTGGDDDRKAEREAEKEAEKAVEEARKAAEEAQKRAEEQAEEDAKDREERDDDGEGND